MPKRYLVNSKNTAQLQVKYSKAHLIISGTVVEYYQYENPIAYNLPPLARSESGNFSQSRRDDNLNALRHRVRRLVETNKDAYGYEAMFVTFTYHKNELDLKKAHVDFKAFIRRLRNELGYSPKYLNVAEFQERGAVHFHSIFFNIPESIERNESCPRIACMAFSTGFCEHRLGARKMAIMWGQGMLKWERIRSVKSVGAYVCKYLNKSAGDERLIGKKFYTTSRGLFQPDKIRDEKSIADFFLHANIKEVERMAGKYIHPLYGKVTYKQFMLM